MRRALLFTAAYQLYPSNTCTVSFIMKNFSNLLAALISSPLTPMRWVLGTAQEGMDISTITVSSLEYDSRQCHEGSLFVALRGLSVDGHHFALDAVQRGTRVIICEEPIREPDDSNSVLSDVLQIVVPNSRQALGALAHAWYDFPSTRLRVFGVTGTNGKTTTTFILKALLEAVGETVGIIGTTGNYVGKTMLPASFTTPESPELCALFAKMYADGVTSVVMEVSSHALSMERVHGTTFAGAIFTNLTQDHLDFHQTMDEYAAAKKKLFDMLPASAVAVFNGDDPYAGFMSHDAQARQQLFFGRSAQAGVRITNEQLSITQTSFAVEFAPHTPSEDVLKQAFTMSLVGRFNIDNATGCLALCYGLGYKDLTLLARGLNVALPAPGRMQRIPLPNGAAAVVDYAHTPDALEKALLSCKDISTSAADNQEINNDARILCIFGCGGNRDRTKRPTMGAIATRLADVTIVTSDNPRAEEPDAIIADILDGIPSEQRSCVTVLADRAAAIRHGLQQTKKGDILLIAGKGHENYQIVGNHRLHFDDVEQVAHYVQDYVQESTGTIFTASI